jgi:hypothetical protein
MDNIDKWVKIGIAGSAIWTFLLFLVSYEGMGLTYFRFDLGGGDDEALPLILGGCAVIWIVSYFFFRDEEE